MLGEIRLARNFVHVLVYLVLSLTFGCSQGTDSELEHTLSVQQGLTFAVSLTAPRPLSPVAPTLGGSSSVRLGASAQVVTGTTVAMGSGGITTEPNALLNETWSRGTAALNNGVKVRGTLHARTRSLGIGASVTTWDQNPSLDPVSTLSWQVTYPSGTALDITVNSNGTRSLDPGRYGTILLNSGAVLTLKTGVYYLNGLNMQSSSIVKLDQSRGPIVVYMTNACSVRGSFVPLSGTDPDLLLAFLGSNSVLVETLFNGAIIAPSAALTLRSVNSVHTGFFYARDITLDAGARVKYRSPLAVIRAASPPGSKCRELLAGAVPDSSTYKYCPGCVFPIDTDKDGVEDCVDGCKFDALKSVPGSCGCNVAETDTDLDGVPDCQDDCELDPNNTSPGQCGCLSSDPDIRPRVAAGTSCTDTACPQTGTATCSATGVCGNRTSCVPATGCKLVQYERSSYWFCPGPVTESAAAQACRSKQMALVSVDGFQENLFLRSRVTAPTWIGANSISASGVWRWTTATNNDGTQLWQGTANGAQRNGQFSAWAPGAPASQRCAVVQPDGRWVDVDCNQGLGYVCEFTAPLRPGPVFPLPGGPAQPPAQTACIAQAASFLPPETEAGFQQLQSDFNAAQESPPRFIGAAQSPPPLNSNNCVNNDAANAIGDPAQRAGCGFTPVTEPAGFSCFEDADCTPLGANLFCRQLKDAPDCVPTDANPCPGQSHCGRLNCPPPETTTCQQIEVCGASPAVTPDLSGSSLTPDPFNPAALFGGTLPSVTPAANYSDPPDRGPAPKDHAWCFMNAQHGLPGATQPEKGKQGQSGGASSIKFSFDPDLQFEADVNPLSLGETKLNVHARAQLVTKVKLTNFIGTNFERDILAAVADIRAERCTLRNDETKFTVFGHDFVDLIGVPKFDTSDPSSSWYDETTRCNKAVGSFIDAANRAKKAFRDAQQLLAQYKSLKDLNGGNLRNLCQSVVSAVGEGAGIRGFPDGLACPANEPAEITINRFVEYYQAPGFGQVSRVREAVKELSAITQLISQGWNKRMTFGPKPKGESRTIVQAQFQIGPVPVVLQIDAFYSYGVAGFFDIGLKFPYNPFSEETVQRNEIAHVKAGIMPYANAGLNAFVGAGRSLGPFSATLGIEGSVLLGDVKAPIFAGAGLGAEVTQDVRSLAPDIGPLANATLQAVGLDNLTHFGKPKAFKFFVWYDYGAALEATDILRGTINARLRIKFAFFSRTWRKQIVKFNGFGPFRVDLVSGKLGADPSVSTKSEAVDYQTKAGAPATSGTTVVEGTTDVGLSEAQVPLLVLQPLPLPTALPVASATDRDFDSTAVQGMFYDNLCCAKVGDPVASGVNQCTLPGEAAERGGAVPCCPGLSCDATAAGTRCVEHCKEQAGECTNDGQCCPIPKFNVSCGSGGTCGKCGIAAVDLSGAPCTAASECCGFDAPNSLITCGAGHTCQTVCRSPGQVCQSAADCCPGTPGKFDTSCSNNACAQCARIDVQAPCNQHSDCCGFVPNGMIQCSPLTQTCVHIIP